MIKEARILFLLIALLSVGFVSATVIYDDLHLNIQTVDSDANIITGSYDFVFNISNSSDCTDTTKIIYTNSTTLTTDARGIVSYYLPNVSLNYDVQYWLCYYRNSTLQATSKIAKTPYTFRAMDVNMSGITVDANLDASTYNITASWFKGKINASNVSNENWIEASSESTLDVNASTWWGGVTSFVSGWFTETANALGFNETKLNDTIWNIAGNGTLADNTTMGTYVRAKNDSLALWVLAKNYLTSFTEQDPQWSDNFTKYNSSWSSIINSSYLRDTGDTATGTYEFNGGWGSSGLSIIGGDIYAQTGFFYNITGLEVTTLRVNGSLIPQRGWDDTFDIGNATLRWRDLFLGRNAYINGSLDIFGNTLIGNAAEDTVIFSAEVASHIIPNDNARDLGSSAKRWSTLYVDLVDANNLSAGNASIGGTTYQTFTIFTNNSGDDLYNVSLAFERGIPVTNAVIKWDNVTNSFEFNFPVRIQENNNLTVDKNTLFVDGNLNRVGIGTTTPMNLLNVLGDANITGNLFRNNKLLIDWSQAVNGTLFTQALWNTNYTANNDLWTTTWAEIDNSTFAPISEPLWKANWTAYNSSWSSIINSSYLRDTGDTATGNYTFDTSTLFIDSTRDRLGINATNPLQTLNIRGNLNITNYTNAGSGLIWHNGTGICIGSC